MCLRKLSEAVYSHSNFQASSRVGIRLSPHGAVSVAWEAVGNEAGRWRQAWSYTDLSGCIPDQFSTAPRKPATAAESAVSSLQLAKCHLGIAFAGCSRSSW